MDWEKVFLVGVVLPLVAYTVIGTEGRVAEIKRDAPAAINERGWEIMRYEGYQRGAWSKHGGKVWYHVKDTGVRDSYYRVHITRWGDELHFYYSEPEKLIRANVAHASPTQ